MARTVLEVVAAMNARPLEQGLGRAGKATDKFGKDVDRSSKRARSGFASIGGAAKLAGGAIVASGIVAGLRDIASAAAESEVSTVKLKSQLKASGVSYRAHAKEIDKVIQKTSRLAALDDEDLQDAFTNIVRVTGNVTQSMKLTGVAADIARAKHIDVAKAGQMLGKVADGNVGSLKKLGVSFTPVTTAQDALTKSGEKFTKAQMDQAKATDKTKTTAGALAAVQKTFAGQAAAYGKTSAGAMEGLDVASENLKETLGKALAPAMASAAGGLTKFIGEIQSGEGSGGKFADAMGEVADEAKHVYSEIKPVVETVGQFVAKHPGILKAAGGLVAVGLAVKTIRFAGAITGLSTLMTAAAKAGRGPGMTIGGKMVSGIRSALGAGAGGLKTVLTSVLSRAGSGAGATAADRTVSSMDTNLRSGKNNAKMRGAGGVAGRIFGRAVTAGALFAVVGIGVAIAAKLNEEVTNALGLGGTGKGANANGFSTRPGDGSQDLQKTITGFLGGLIGKRKGGFISRFQGGGMVPAFVSPGEMIVHGGQASMVPGARTAADSVFTQLPVGAAVLTDHGQSLIAGGASLSQAVAMQAPHFANGGVVAARAARKVGLSSTPLVTSVAIAKAESGWRTGIVSPRNSNGTYDRGMWQINDVHRLDHAKLVKDVDYNARAMRSISKGGKSWSPWSTFKNGAYRQYMDEARRAVNGTRDDPLSGNYRTGDERNQLSRKLVLGGQFSGDARTLGYTEALDGKVGARGSTLASLIGGGIGKMRTTTSSTPIPSSSRSTGGGASGSIKAGGGWGGSENIVRGLIAGLGAATFKRASGHRLSISNPGSDHNTANKGAFAADIGASGARGDRIFSTIAKRAGIPARKGSWNKFNGKPVGGYRTQLLWHAPDGSHKDHVHLGVRKMRRGGFASFAKGGTVAGVLKPGSTDSSGVHDAFLSLAKRLEDGTRTTFTYLGQLIRTAMSHAAAARKAGDKVEARRYDSVGDLARYEQGRRMAAPILRLGTVTTSVDRQEGRWASRQTIAGIDGGSAAGIAASIARGETSLGQLEGQLPGLKRALSQAKKTKNKKAIADITKAIADLDDGILSRQATLAEQGRALEAQKLTDAENQKAFIEAVRAKMLSDRYDPFAQRESAGSLALLRAQVDTPGDTRDDLAALNTSLQAATEGYNAAVAGFAFTGDSAHADQITQFAGDILSLRSSIEGMAANVADMTAAVTDNTAALQEELDFRRKAFAIGQTETGVVGRAFADLVSGELGGKVGLGLMTPGYAGSTARY
jgi:hypothetical protein